MTNAIRRDNAATRRRRKMRYQADELAYLPANEALRLFRSRQLSPVELLEAVIARAEAVEPQVNAFAERLFETALAQARQAEARYAGRGTPPRPLEGIPVAVKEAQPIAGRPWTEGSLIMKDRTARVTHPVVERIENAGAIIHARTTTPEFSCAGFTHSPLWGITRNPWNLDYSPGGSSGGSGAALAGGATTLATGTDISGSIRIPAAACGVVGYKPPYGRVPGLPPDNLDTYNQSGPLARHVADCALLQNVIAGPHPADAASLRPALQLPDLEGVVEGWRIALSVHLGDYPVDAQVAANTRAAAGALRQAGAIVEEVTLNWKRADISRAWWLHAMTIFAPAIRACIGDRLHQASPYIQGFVQQLQDDYRHIHPLEGLHIETSLYAELGPLLEQYDALICPTTSIPALDAGDDYTDTRLVVDGIELGGYGESLMTTPFNLIGRCPVLAVPSGRAANGVPTGLQIVAPTYEDETAFQIGAALERERPWFGDPSWRPPLQGTEGPS